MEFPHSSQQEAIMMFDSYCKTVIMNRARRYWKREIRRSLYEYSIEESSILNVSVKESDFFDEYTISCGNIQAVFHCFALYNAVEQLTERERTVIVLKYWGNHTDQYVAQYLLVTERTVRNLKSRAYKKIKYMLQKEGNNIYVEL